MALFDFNYLYALVLAPDHRSGVPDPAAIIPELVLPPPDTTPLVSLLERTPAGQLV